ncbi:retrovirus-related pol polyprotein from transposon TNT 1-94 [Tanacetum coccineum]
MELENTQNNALAKLPMLKLGEYENGNSWVPIPVTAPETGPSTATKMTVPSTAEEKICKNNDVKARSLLLMALPNEHQLTFDHLPFEGASSINNINTVNPEVSTGTTKVNTASTEISTASFSDATVYAFLSTQPQGSQLVHEDLEQLHDDDLEEMDLKWNMALLSMRARKFYQRTGRKIIIDGSSTAGYDKSKVECFNCHKMGHFARECRAPRSKDNINWNQGSSSKAVRIEDASEKAMCAIDGAGFDWSDMAEEEIQANMALMAFSDSEVTNDKSCSKSCLKNYEALKKQYDDLLVKLDDTGFKASTYKRGLSILEGQILKYKESEVLFSEEIALLKRSVGHKEYQMGLLRTELEKVKEEKEGFEFKIAKFEKSAKDLDQLLASQITDKSKKGFGYNVVPSPHPLILNRPTPLDLSYSGLEEFKEPESNSQLNDKGFVDSGCSRHMTGNIAHLSDFKDFDGGYVTLVEGSIRSRITGKLPDENQILLKIPKQDNMYSFDMKNIVHKGSLTCLVAKATSDESMLWHRRLGHINFKNINKLVKENLGKGIKREYSIARTPQQNGIAERKNKTLIEAARIMLADSKNRVLIVKPHNKTTYEFFRGFKPAIGFMKPFGCHVAMLNTLDNLGKFDGKSDEGFFIGYSLSSKAFRVYNTRTRKVQENFHIGFLENKHMDEGMVYKSFWSRTSSQQVSTILKIAFIKMGLHDENDATEKSHDDSSLKDNGTAVQQVNTARPEINTGSREVSTAVPEVNTATPEDLVGPSHASEDTVEDQRACFLSQEEPKRVSKALSDPAWVEAMQEELLQFKLQKVWILVDLPKGHRAIGTKWVYRNKKDERGIVIRNKARLVAQGHTQEEGIDMMKFLCTCG